MKNLTEQEKLKIIVKKAHELKIQKPELISLCNKFNLDWIINMTRYVIPGTETKEQIIGFMECAEPSKECNSQITDYLKVEIELFKKERAKDVRRSKKLP